MIAPGASATLSDSMAQSLTADQLTAIQKGTQAIYAFGEIAYTDAFGECRLTRHRLYYYAAGSNIGSNVGLTYLGRQYRGSLPQMNEQGSSPV